MIKKISLLCFVLSVIFFLYFGRFLNEIEMHISLQKGDFVLVLPLTAKVGDAIVVRDPFRKERVHVRRLIALGPATVRYDKNGTITRDDKRITQKDMGILARGGFSFDMSKRVLDLEIEEFKKLIKII